jgi:hypothetical protein
MFYIMDVVKTGDVLSSLIFNLAIEYTIGRIQINEDGLELNCTHQTSDL